VFDVRGSDRLFDEQQTAQAAADGLDTETRLNPESDWHTAIFRQRGSGFFCHFHGHRYPPVGSSSAIGVDTHVLLILGKRFETALEEFESFLVDPQSLRWQ